MPAAPSSVKGRLAKHFKLVRKEKPDIILLDIKIRLDGLCGPDDGWP